MKRKRRLKRKPIVGLICIIILIIVISIFTVNTIKEYNYRKTIEYKLLQVGYNETEIELLKDKTNDKLMNSLLNKEYDKMYIDIIKQKYYLKENADKYIKYYDNNLNSKALDTIALVNTGAHQERYTNVKKADINKDILILNNKYYSLESSYEPEDLVDVKNWYSYGEGVKLRKEAYNSFIEMYNSAKEEKLTLIINSAYRPYSEQKEIYDDYLSRYGQEYTDAYAARPGHSEHQTGLCIDLTTYGAQGDNFDQTDEFKWLQENAHNYGYILRYPKDKEYLTGYNYESWHYRYVGVEAATIIHDSNITFDEYYAYYIDNV